MHRKVVKPLNGAVATSLLSVCVAGAPASAAADDTNPPAPAAAAQSAEQSALTEIVVTAQKRAERLVDVPLSVTVVDATQLQNSGVDSFENLDQIAPGTKINRDGIYFLPSIRGITSQVVGAGQENNVATYIDGFYQPSQVGLDMAFNNVKSVQVLKGPQGTLFGRNATGGAILIDTVDPSGTPVAKASVSFGRFNEATGQVYLSDGITDQLAFDLAGYMQNSDGYIHDIAGFDTAPTEHRDIRSKWVYTPSGSVKITGLFEYMKIDDGTGLAATYYDRQLAPLIDPATPIATTPNETSLNFGPYSQTETTSAGIKSQIDLAEGLDLTSYTRYSHEYGYINFDLDGSELPIFAEHLNTRLDNAAEEIDLHAKGGNLDGVVGLFLSDTMAQYFKEQVLVNAAENLFSAPIDSRLWTRAAAGFADLTYHVNDELTLIGGLRYSWERRTFNFAEPDDTVLVDHVSKSWDAVTPRAVLKYDLNSFSNVYASFSKGFKSGTFNTTTADPTPVNPENVYAYEVGYKYEHGLMQFDTAAYYYNYRDMQVSVLTIINGNEEATNLSNAAKSRIYGLEAQLSVLVTDGLSVSAGLNYNHARYVDYKDASVFPVAPGGLTNSSTPAVQDWSGLRIIGAPDWTGNLTASWKRGTPIGEFGVGGNLYYTSAYAPLYDDQLNGAYRYQQGGYALANGTLSLAPDKHWKLSIWTRNLTNKYYKVNYGGNPFGDQFVYAEPRTYGGRIDYSFN